MIGSNRKAVCIDGGGFANKGAEAMVLTVAHAIRKRLRDTDIYVRIKSRQFQQAHENGLLPWVQDEPTGVVSRLSSKIRTARLYYKCGAFIDVGGYQFGDPWGKKVAWGKARTIRRCAKFGNLIFLMPQAWGPFSFPGIGGAIRSVINTATLCYVRDKASMAAVEKLVGKQHPRVRFAHDIAWNFQGAEPSVGRQLIRDAGLPGQKNSITICVTPNLRLYERCEGTGQNNEYIKFLGEMIEHLCSVHNANVVLMGHELRRDNSKIKDDRFLCDHLLSSLDSCLRVAHIDKDLTAAEVKSVIGNCDLLISSRYHALIAALSQGIPAAAIGWSYKYEELLAEFDLRSNVISLSKPSKEACKDIDFIVESLVGARDKIRSKLPALKMSGYEALKEVVSRIGETFEA